MGINITEMAAIANRGLNSFGQHRLKAGIESNDIITLTDASFYFRKAVLDATRPSAIAALWALHSESTRREVIACGEPASRADALYNQAEAFAAEAFEKDQEQ